MPFLAPAIAAVSAFASTAIGGFIVNAVVGIGLSFASSLLQKKPDKAVGGTKLDVQYGGDRPREIAVGLVAVAGHDVYSNSYGSSNKYLQKVFVLSDFPITAITRVAVNGEWRQVDWNSPDPRGAVVLGFDDGDHLICLRLYDGRHTALKAADLSGEHSLVGASGGRWTADHIGKGETFVIANYRYQDEDQTSVPTLLFEVQGAPLYDVRKDDTAGGFGPHRWDDQSTWEYSENPIVQAYCYERGFHVNGQLLVGKGMPSRDLPIAAWMSAANVCDETTPTRTKRYRSGALFTTGDGVTHRDNLEPVLEAASANLAELVDGDHPIVGANQPVVATITDDDRIVGSPWNYQAKRSRSELVNSVYGTYNKPEDLWESTSYEPRVSATALAADRERHAVSLDFSTVDNESQASDLAEAQLRRNRYQASEMITVRPRWMVLEIGDWITRASAKYGTRTMQVVAMSLGALGPENARNVTLTLDEVGAGIYDTSVTIPERPIRVDPAPPSFTSTVYGFQAYASSVTGQNGRVMPVIAVQFDVIDDLTVDAVLVRYFKTSDPTNRITKIIQQPAVLGLLVEGVLPVTSYTVEATVITNPVRATIWTEPLTLTTLTENLAVDLSQITADFDELLADINEQIDTSVEAVADEAIARAAAIAAEAEARADAAADLAADLAAEAAARAAATQALADDIADEAQTRADDIAAEADARQDAIQAEGAQRSADVLATAGAFRALQSELLAVAMDTAEQGARGLATFQTLRTELKIAADNARAGWTEAVTVAVGPGSAVVERFTQLDARVTGETTARSAAITALETAYIAADAAEATTRQTLAAQVRGNYAGTDHLQVSEGIIANMRTAFASQYAALAQDVMLLTAGTERTFDYVKLWEFDSTVQGWGGNGAPAYLAGGGFLRPADHASDPYVTSPTGLGIATDTYSQALIRIRKTGAPVWDGQFWWRSAGDSATWSTARRITIPEPTFDANGYSVVSIDPGYSLTLDQIRLDLSVAQTATAYYSIDWIAIGRPSLGASRAALTDLNTTLTNSLGAEASSRQLLTTSLMGPADPATATLATLSSGLLYQERFARSTADTAMAGLITALDSRLDDAETGLSGQATITETLTTDVTTIVDAIDDMEVLLGSTAEKVTTLESDIEDKADSSVVDLLSAEVFALSGDGVIAQAEATRSLRSSLILVELEGADRAADLMAGEQAVRQATADAYQTMSTRVSQVDGRVDLAADAITGIQLSLPGKADVSVVSALTSTVTSQGASITSQGAAITTLQNSLAGKASASALSSLSSTVTTQGNTITTQGSDITTLQNSLAGKASASALSSLSSTVTTQGNTITTQGSDITTLQNSLAGKASASALSSLSSTVTTQGNTITTQGSDITTLQNSLAGKASASALSSLSSTVTTQGNTITTQGSDITTLQNSLAGKASASALSSLSSTVTTQGNTITTQGSDITTLQNSLAGKASASALSSLSSTVTTQGNTITTQGSDITTLQNSLAGKASASALSSLSSTVTTQGNTITTQGSDITTLQNSLAGKASASALSSLSSTVTTQGNTITTQGSDITTLQNSLAGKASASALSSLSSTVTTQGNTITTQGSDITTLQNSLGDKASSSALSTLDSKVTTINGVVTAQGTAITALNSTMGDLSASGLISIYTSAAPSGVISQVNFAARVSDNGTRGTAAFSLQAYSQGGTIKTRALLYAGSFVFSNGVLLDDVRDDAALGAQSPATRINQGTVTISGDKVRAGEIVANNNKMVIDLDGGSLKIYGN